MRGELHVVDDVASAFREQVLELAPRVFGLSGGSTAKRCYRALRERGVSWADTRFFLGDERWVPVDHPDSNEGQARREWLDAVPSGEIASPVAAHATVEAAADAYDDVVAAWQPVDVLHLSLGEDGHIASLFPDSPALDVSDRLVVATGDDLHEWPRLTLTFPAIERCRTVLVTVSGEQKRDAFARVRRGDPALPATRLRAPRLVWLVDRAAEAS